MCVVSLITDHYADKWRDRLPNTLPGTGDPLYPQWLPPPQPKTPTNQSMDVEALKKMLAPKEPAITQEEIAEFRALLARAREYDARNNEPACEMREKQDALIAVAKALGLLITIEDLNG